MSFCFVFAFRQQASLAFQQVDLVGWLVHWSSYFKVIDHEKHCSYVGEAKPPSLEITSTLTSSHDESSHDNQAKKSKGKPGKRRSSWLFSSKQHGDEMPFLLAYSGL